MFGHWFKRGRPVIDENRIWAENDADRWVLALGAPYVEASYPTVETDPIWFEKLDGGYPPDMAETCRQTLSDDWGIVDKESMLKGIRAVLEFGHRDEYDKIRSLLVENSLLGKSETALTAVARFRVENQYSIEDEEEREKAIGYLASAYGFVTHTEPMLGQAGIAAWDYMRVGNVTSLALAGGLAEPADCWPLLYQAARAAQQRLASWRQAAESFNWGRRWWGQASPESEKKFEEIAERLRDHPDSPWQKLDWNTDLDPTHHPDLEAQAKSGTVRSQYLLANQLAHGRGRPANPKLAFSWMLKAAENGYPRAQNEVGIMYQTGTGTAVDLDAAERWYRAGAENGNAFAKQNLGRLRESRRFL